VHVKGEENEKITFKKPTCQINQHCGNQGKIHKFTRLSTLLPGAEKT
jgi:hypothetical protein